MTNNVARFFNPAAFYFLLAVAAQAQIVNRVAAINIQEAISSSNEGQRDFEALAKKLEPNQTELKNMNDEVESLKKQLNTSGDKTGDSQATLVKRIEQKQKALERAAQDARDDAQNQQKEIAQRILQKMAPIIVKYAVDNAYGLVMDTSNPWPQSPVLWTGPGMDITKPIVSVYNLQSGVPSPEKPAPQPQVAQHPVASGSNTYDDQLKKAMVLWKSSQVSEAIKAVAALIQSTPNRWEGYGLAGAIEKAQNKLPEAKASYQRALTLAPDSVKPQIAQAIQQIETEQGKP